jgi:TolB-like protein
VAVAGDALAVLPFENVGGDQRTEYLSDGVADQTSTTCNSFNARV